MTTPGEEQQSAFAVAAAADDAFHALGRYVFTFSWLAADLRDSIARYVAIGGPPATKVAARLALGESTAQPLANALFSIIGQYGGLNAEEKAIAKQLQREVNAVITRRNDFTHGDWYIGWGVVPMLDRIKPARSSGPWRGEFIPAADLDAASDRLAGLIALVHEFTALAIGPHPLDALPAPPGGGGWRVADIMTLRGDQVVRGGPRAGEYDFDGSRYSSTSATPLDSV